MLNDEDYKEFLVPYVVCVIFVLVLLALLLCFVPNHRSGDAGVGERIDAATAIIGEGREQQQAINLTGKLNELRQKSQQQEKLLVNAEQALNDANSLLQQYVQEQNRTQNRLRKQRNLAWFLLGGFVIYRLADGI